MASRDEQIANEVEQGVGPNVGRRHQCRANLVRVGCLTIVTGTPFVRGRGGARPPAYVVDLSAREKGRTVGDVGGSDLSPLAYDGWMEEVVGGAVETAYHLTTRTLSYSHKNQSWLRSSRNPTVS